MSDQAQPKETLEGGNYEVIRRRLLEQAAEIGTKAEALNQKRKTVFGGTELGLVANERARTENNCIPRDMVSVAGHLLFGFEVFMGLKEEVKVSDVLTFHRFGKTAEGYDIAEVPPEGPLAFLSDATFVKEFKDVFRYMKDAKLSQLRRTETRLLCSVQVGASVKDVKVFRWAIDAKGGVSYMDARGDEDYAPPRSHDFAWTATGRENQVAGKFPHISVLNEVFVETLGGDLTIKVENNTKEGQGIYREPVDDPNQTLDDADIAYAKVGSLILLKIRPFREQAYRYLVYDTRNKRVTRIDAIGQACLGLPEGHGIVFPGGVYLDSGERKVFDGDIADMEFERVIPSPNGEDVAYVFYRHHDGQYVIMPYNLIRKEADSPMRCNGYSLFPDGTLAIFRASAEATRIHPIQVWRTPFTTAEFAAGAKTDGSYLAKVGNADLVRGISDALALRRLASKEDPSRQTYEDVVRGIGRLIDAYYWLGNDEAGNLLATLQTLKKTSELIIDEFEKLAEIRKRAAEQTAKSEATFAELEKRLAPDGLGSIDAFLGALTDLRRFRGELVTLRELRGVEPPRIDALEQKAVALFDAVSAACVKFLLARDAFADLVTRLDGSIVAIEKVVKASELLPFEKDLDTVQTGLTLLGDVVSALAIDDVTERTKILEGVSAAFAQLNRARATFQARKKELSSKEGKAEFGVQFKLFGQAVAGALAVCDTPERCDQELSKLLLSLEELEGKFAQFDEFAVELADKRQEVQDAISARRQLLTDERQKRAGNLAQAAERVLAGVVRRAQTFATQDELNAYFASDPSIQKVQELQKELGRMGDTVRADEIASRLKSARQDSQRALRDKTDLFAEGAIRFGAHRFSVNTQPMELTLIPREGTMMLHLTGTDFYETLDDPELAAAKDLWEQALPSESNAVYRGEFLATQIFAAAEAKRQGLTFETLKLAHTKTDGLLDAVREFARDRIDEGYERGVHDFDASLILERLLSLRETVGLLRFSPDARAQATLHWLALAEADQTSLRRKARAAVRIREELGDSDHLVHLTGTLGEAMASRTAGSDLAMTPAAARAAAEYLILELSREPLRFTTTREAVELLGALRRELTALGSQRDVEADLAALGPHEALPIARAYLEGFLKKPERAALRPFLLEAAVVWTTEGRIDRDESAAVTRVQVTGLLGRHPRIEDRKLEVSLDELLPRVDAFIGEQLPRFRAYRKLRTEILEREKARLRITEFAPRVLTSFVRNRLIDEVYLPLIGANLAKQIGDVSEKKRTDLMGMLLLISPPGYGKTTLMEYVASKLGLVFMKVNGPALGHDVTSLDPAEAKNATARQEVEKISLALEMGNNVMLYLDDIQHTSAELLQKFISLCDAQRRIEGVWKGKTRTYDLRGKKFCIVMAGNPYTESGERFRIPDMLANRADTYNLGDILGGKEDIFALSYLENALTSSSILAPLAGREPKDVHKLIRLAQGEEVPLTDLSHGYSGAEVEDFTAVFQRLFTVQATLLQVNREYIASASQDDSYRTEPPFKLQGSYRNMNKLAEKVVPAMNQEELLRLIDDHYKGESQTLTTSAEQNVLKLAEMRGRITPEQQQRWKAIKEEFLRKKRMGGKDDDPVARVTGTLSGLDSQLQGIGETLKRGLDDETRTPDWSGLLDKVQSTLSRMQAPRVDLHLESGGTAELTSVVAEHTALLSQVITALAKRPSQLPPAQGGGGHEVAARIEDLARILERMEQKLRAPSGSSLSYEVALDAGSPSNFFRGFEGNDVIAHGGLFVATYEKLPPLGARATARLAFPGGAACDVEGTVLFRQDLVDDEGASLVPGFGLRIENVTTDGAALIAVFARQREPMVRE